MSDATLVVLENLNAQNAQINVDINAALVAGNSTVSLRKRQAALEADRGAAQARHDAAVTASHAAALQAAEDAAVSLALEASGEVNRALAEIGAELRLSADDHRFLAVARGVKLAQLAVDEVESRLDAAHAKFERVHEQLAKAESKHAELVASRQAGDESEKTASALYAVSFDLTSLRALAAQEPARGKATTELEFLANAKGEFERQKNSAILDLARQDIANVESAFIERVRGLDHYARSNRLVIGGSVFSVVKPGERISYMLRTGSIPA